MTLQHVTDLKAPIGDVIDRATEDGMLIETDTSRTYALMPLDDELLDYLLERNPRFARECRKIRSQMQKGDSHSHDEVKRMLGR
ncbi:MAG: hypothetical protein ABSH20_00300 [Tepidisphaeraceae bacterium]